MMRFVDIMYALPYILFVIILVVIFGRIAGAAVRRHRVPRMADHGAHRARADAVASRSASSSRRRKAGGARALHHHLPPHRAQPHRPGGDLRDADRSRDHPHRELPLLSRPRRAGAADLAGHADLVRRAGGRDAALDAVRPGRRPRQPAALPHLSSATACATRSTPRIARHGTMSSPSTTSRRHLRPAPAEVHAVSRPEFHPRRRARRWPWSAKAARARARPSSPSWACWPRTAGRRAAPCWATST